LSTLALSNAPVVFFLSLPSRSRSSPATPHPLLLHERQDLFFPSLLFGLATHGGSAATIRIFPAFPSPPPPFWPAPPSQREILFSLTDHNCPSLPPQLFLPRAGTDEPFSPEEVFSAFFSFFNKDAAAFWCFPFPVGASSGSLGSAHFFLRLLAKYCCTLSFFPPALIFSR